jgi:hypothetical protein
MYLNGMIYASVATLNAPPWFGRAARRSANQTNGVIVVTSLQFMLLVAIGTLINSAEFLRVISKEIAISIGLLLFVANYWILVWRDGGEQYSEFFLQYGRYSRIIMRGFVVVMFIVLTEVVARNAPK